MHLVPHCDHKKLRAWNPVASVELVSLRESRGATRHRWEEAEDNGDLSAHRRVGKTGQLQQLGNYWSRSIHSTGAISAARAHNRFPCERVSQSTIMPVERETKMLDRYPSDDAFQPKPDKQCRNPENI
jgi:hypothetical protein